jgi:hypothetical protein
MTVADRGPKPDAVPWVGVGRRSRSPEIAGGDPQIALSACFRHVAPWDHG